MGIGKVVLEVPGNTRKSICAINSYELVGKAR